MLGCSWSTSRKRKKNRPFRPIACALEIGVLRGATCPPLIRAHHFPVFVFKLALEWIALPPKGSAASSPSSILVGPGHRPRRTRPSLRCVRLRSFRIDRLRLLEVGLQQVLDHAKQRAFTPGLGRSLSMDGRAATPLGATMQSAARMANARPSSARRARAACMRAAPL